MRRAARTLGAAVAALWSVALFGAAPAARAEAPLGFDAPEGLVVLPWPGEPSAAQLEPNTGSRWLEPGEVLLVPAEPGDVVHVATAHGERPSLGLASGHGEWPDVITWDLDGPSPLRVPAWSTARFVAARVQKAGFVSARVGELRGSALDWYSWDRSVGAWLRGSGERPALVEASTAARLVRWLEATRQSVPEPDRGELAELLQACWLDESARWRPLTGPYFALERRLESDAPRRLRAGERVELAEPGIDVVRWRFQALGAARVLVREGNAAARVLSWPATSLDTATRPRSVRVVPPPGSGRVSFEVLEGELLVQQSAWARRAGASEVLGAPLRLRRELLERARGSRLAWVRRLAEARASRSLSSAELVGVAEAAPPGDVRAWILLEAARSEPDVASAIALAERAAQAARSLPAEILALEQRWDIAPSPSAGRAMGAAEPDAAPPSSHGVTAAPGAGGSSHDELLATALRARQGRTDGARPALGSTLERWAIERGADDDAWAALAGYWRSVPYRSVLPEPGAPTSVEYVPLPAAACTASTPDTAEDDAGERAGDRFERWLLPEPGTTLVTAALPRQRFAKLWVRSLGITPAPEQSVTLGGLSVPVHAGAGLTSEIGLGAGAHPLIVPEGTAPFAIRLSDGVTAPCERLRRVRTWTELARGSRADFVLPAPGAASVARVTVATSPDFGPGITRHELAVRLGARRYVIWARGAASGAGELAVGAGDTALSLESEAALRARVDLRRAPDAPPAPPDAASDASAASAQSGTGASSGVQGGPTQPDPAESAPSAPAAGQRERAEAARAELDAEPEQGDLDRVLEGLRGLGRRLRAADAEPERQALRVKRARLLDALGFTGLARRDAGREPESRRDAEWLPAEPRSVIPLNLAAKIPPLPLPAAADGLRERRRRLSLAGCGGALAAPQPTGTPGLAMDAETLLVAHCAEQTGQVVLAAQGYEAIGAALPSGAALSRAVSLLADQSLIVQDPALALRARMLASRAAALGEDTGDLLARLDPALRWVVPTSYERALGFATVELDGPPPPTVGARVRRALVDAPDAALLLEGERDVEIVARGPERLELEIGCEDLGGSACEARVQIDLVPVPCAPVASGLSRCTVELAPDKHRVEVGLASATGIGWVKATLAGQPISSRIAARWIEVQPRSPAELTVLGPTLVVVEARGAALPGQAVAWTGCSESSTGAREIALPETRDPGATRLAAEQPELGHPVRVEIPVYAAGPCTLSVRSTSGSALLRMSVARALGLPRARVAPPLEAAPVSAPLAAGLGEARPIADVPPPALGDEGLPFLLLGRTRAVSSVFRPDAEGEPRSSAAASRHVELSALAAREILPNLLWTSVTGGVRGRDGPPTVFGRFRLELPPSIGLPGFELEASSHAQDLELGWYASLRATATASGLIPLGPDLNLLPSAAFTIDREPAEPFDRGVDLDVYSRYRDRHPRYLQLEVALNWRPLVDGFGKFELSSRGLPDFDGVDRATATASWFMVPVSELNALVDVSAATSFRPQGPLRADAFWRQSFGAGGSFWHWLSGGERLRVYARLDGVADLGAERADGVALAAEVGVELLTSGLRGLTDIARLGLPFRDFQERGRAGATTLSREGAEP